MCCVLVVSPSSYRPTPLLLHKLSPFDFIDALLHHCCCPPFVSCCIQRYASVVHIPVTADVARLNRRKRGTRINLAAFYRLPRCANNDNLTQLCTAMQRADTRSAYTSGRTSAIHSGLSDAQAGSSSASEGHFGSPSPLRFISTPTLGCCTTLSHSAHSLDSDAEEWNMGTTRCG